MKKTYVIRILVNRILCEGRVLLVQFDSSASSVYSLTSFFDPKWKLTMTRADEQGEFRCSLIVKRLSAFS